MIVKNIIFLSIIFFVFNGCTMGPATYEAFEKNVNMNAYHYFNPKTTKLKREIYSKEKYILIEIILLLQAVFLAI